MFYEQFECHQRNKKQFWATEMPIKMRPWGKRSNIHAKFAEKEFHEKFLRFLRYLFCGWDKQSFFFTLVSSIFSVPSVFSDDGRRVEICLYVVGIK